MAVGKRIEGVLKQVSGAADVKVEQVTGLPVLTITPDRAAVSRYGLNVAEVQSTIEAALGGQGRRPGVRGRPALRHRDAAARGRAHRSGRLGRLPIPLPASKEGSGSTDLARSVAMHAPGYVPLSELAKFEVAPGPNQISRENGKRRVVVTANVRGRDLGSFVDGRADARSQRGRAAGRVLDRLWRHVRAAAVCDRPPSDRRARRPRPDLRSAVHGLRLDARMLSSSSAACRWR